MHTYKTLFTVALILFGFANLLRLVPVDSPSALSQASRKELRDDPEKMSITKDSPQKKPKIQTEEKKAVAINTLGSGDLDIREQDVEDVQSKTHVYSSQKCEDREDRCRVWAQTGECLSNAAFMFPTCPQSCGDCLHFTSPKLKAHAKVQLLNGDLMPSVGFGTAGLGEQTFQAVLDALEAGYRLFDSAQAREWYREDLVGQALKASKVDRNALFLTSKLHPRDLFQAGKKVKQSLTDLDTEYLDLFLLHYSGCSESLCGKNTRSSGTWQTAWKELEEKVDSGKIRSLGVSNFDLKELSELLKIARIKPSVVQVRSDPISSNHHIQAFCTMAGIQFQAYSSLGTQWTMQNPTENPVLSNAAILSIAEKLNCTPAQIVLRWALQHGQAVLPRSRSKEHMLENRDIFKRCSLTDRDMMEIDALDPG